VQRGGNAWLGDFARSVRGLSDDPDRTSFDLQLNSDVAIWLAGAPLAGRSADAWLVASSLWDLRLCPLIAYRRSTTDHQCDTVIHFGGYQSHLWMLLSPDAKDLIGEALANRLHLIEVKFYFSETLKPGKETLCFRPTHE
jgi:hypothetical protein